MRVVNVFVIDTHKAQLCTPGTALGTDQPSETPAKHKRGAGDTQAARAETGPLCKASPQTAPAFTHLPEQLYPPGRLKQLV